MDSLNRTKAHKRSLVLEQLLNEVNDLLEQPEHAAIDRLTQPKLPALFIVGTPRSGTTLLYQWLAASGLFSYPSNIMSRFYKAPYVGGMIHKIFVDHDKRGEIFGRYRNAYTSELGKTVGAHSPHEFWYFWRRFFDFGEIQKLNQHELSKVDHTLFLKELAAIEYCFEKPLLLKALIMNWNIDYLNQVIKKPLFLYIKRNALHTMASLFKARKIFFNDAGKWYSFKPPEYERLKNEDIYIQLAGQVWLTNQHIEKTLRRMNPDCSIALSYEAFCKNPSKYYNIILTRLNRFGYFSKEPYQGPDMFKASLKFIADFDVAKAKEALTVVKRTYR